MRGDLDRAQALLDESASRFEAAADEAGLATVLVRRAYLAIVEDELGDARVHLEAALELRDGLNDRRGRGLVLSGLGLVETAAGNFDAAERVSRSRSTSSGARATGGGSRALSGVRPTLHSHAAVSTTRRPPYGRP